MSAAICRPRWVALVGLAAAALMVAVSGCQNAEVVGEQSRSGEASAAAPEVEVTQVRRQTWPETVRVQGSLLGHETSVVGAKLEGRVERVEVDLGSVVRQGEPLVVLDGRELELQARQAEAQLAQACAAVGLDPADSEAELDREQSPPVVLEKAMVDEARALVKRAEQLRARNAVTAEEYTRLETQLRAAEARYRSALNDVGEKVALIGVRRAELALVRQQIADLQVVAPYDGVVERRHVAPGEYVQPGDAVATMVRADTLRFSAGVPERTAARIRDGQAVRIVVAGVGAPLSATVSRVSPSVDRASRALLVEADVPNREARLRTGLFAEAEIVIDDAARVLAVPASAVSEFAGIQKVWLVREGEAVEQSVRTGRRDRQRVEILNGIAEGDLVVTDSSEGQAGPVIAVREQASGEPQTVSSTAISNDASGVAE